MRIGYRAAWTVRSEAEDEKRGGIEEQQSRGSVGMERGKEGKRVARQKHAVPGRLRRLVEGEGAGAGAGDCCSCGDAFAFGRAHSEHMRFEQQAGTLVSSGTATACASSSAKCGGGAC